MYRRQKGCRFSALFYYGKAHEGIFTHKKAAFLTDNIINNNVEPCALFINFLEALEFYEDNVLLTKFRSLKSGVSPELEISIFNSHPWVRKRLIYIFFLLNR